MCQRTLHRPTFLERKGRQKNFPPKYIALFWRKLLKIHKKLFSKSFLCRSLRRKPQLITHTKKARQCRAFLICQYMLELPFQTLLQGAFFKKPLENPQKLPSNTPLYFGKAFEVPRNFSRKVSCVGVWGG